MFGGLGYRLRMWLHSTVPAWRLRPGGRLPEDLAQLVDERGLYIHIPKCGGNSVSRLVYGRKIYHRPASELILFHPIRYLRWFKVAVIRDPVDRFLSAFDFLSRGGKNGQDRLFAGKYLDDDVGTFIETLARDRNKRRRVLGYFHFRPQRSYVCLGRTCIVDRLVPFERLSEEIGALTGRLGDAVPHVNVTHGERTQASALPEHAQTLIRQMYQSDFVLHRWARDGPDRRFGRRLPRA